ncbi:hypothetical protein KFL_001640230 [Klebsormidium nitens]|uniref:Expansin-like EG45 domain-containing protein n=1 Tax=Klebsormidium nitens TaxID=105231 RepID=A0A0U9HK06_KLENI|nr:hypothetical protein KFL_001640230 [Klebsormidium nitens]|eukprot:GAQ83848.1 hypothetical protein KFL_001640230 [Klebsormidium nitens]
MDSNLPRSAFVWIAALSLLAGPAAATYFGNGPQATHYGDLVTGVGPLGACEWGDPLNNPFFGFNTFAGNPTLRNQGGVLNAGCGLCFDITCDVTRDTDGDCQPGVTLRVYLDNECPAAECAPDHFDLSFPAWNQLSTHPAAGILPITITPFESVFRERSLAFIDPKALLRASQSGRLSRLDASPDDRTPPAYDPPSYD